MSRAEERRRDWIAAQREKLNTNGMLMRGDSNPLSTRTASEISQTMAAPDPEPAPRDHVTGASTGHVVYGGSVRDRIEHAEALKREERDAPKPVTQSESAARHLAYAEAYRAIHGEYPRHGI